MEVKITPLFSVREFAGKWPRILARVREKKDIAAITYHGRLSVLIGPYSEAGELYHQVSNGKISYEDYRTLMLERGYEDLVSGKVRVLPQHIVASEKVEIERARNQLFSAPFMLIAARYFGNYLKPHLCINCGYRMIPEKLAEDARLLKEAEQLIGEPLEGLKVQNKPSEQPI